jgi:hypothetical protein
MTRATVAPLHRSHLFILSSLFLLALVPRLFGANTVGWGWDQPGSFSLVNFDEGGSCRAALDGFGYSTFVGRGTLQIARMLGVGADPAIRGDARAVKAYCHSPEHIRIARNVSAVMGALTVVALSLIGLALMPQQPGVAWTAGALLAVSGVHISESQTGTVDATSVFFAYAFMALLIYAVRSRSRGLLWLSPVLLVPAVWAKYWVFAVFAYLAFLPTTAWEYLTRGMSSRRVALVVLSTAILFGLVTNSEFQAAGLYPLLALYYLVIPWRRIARPLTLLWLLLPFLAYALTRVEVIATYTTGVPTYAAIGWHKWLRNLVNVPAVLVVALGLPAFLFIPLGIRAMMRDSERRRAWLCLLPVLVFLLYMAFLAPVTYYRHYLALLPAAALLSACGLFATQWSRRPLFLASFLLWPALLAYDLLADYQNDPRIELRDWYRQHPQARVLFSYYVNPPRSGMANSRLFRPEYAFGDGDLLRQADYVILSENWYDTAFANELNGPLVGVPERMIKTRPEYVEFYRQVLSGQHPILEPERAISLDNFMPELVAHRAFYGTFQIFVGDIRIYRVEK